MPQDDTGFFGNLLNWFSTQAGQGQTQQQQGAGSAGGQQSTSGFLGMNPLEWGLLASVLGSAVEGPETMTGRVNSALAGLIQNKLNTGYQQDMFNALDQLFTPQQQQQQLQPQVAGGGTSGVGAPAAMGQAKGRKGAGLADTAIAGPQEVSDLVPFSKDSQIPSLDSSGISSIQQQQSQAFRLPAPPLGTSPEMQNAVFGNALATLRLKEQARQFNLQFPYMKREIELAEKKFYFESEIMPKLESFGATIDFKRGLINKAVDHQYELDEIKMRADEQIRAGRSVERLRHKDTMKELEKQRKTGIELETLKYEHTSKFLKVGDNVVLNWETGEFTGPEGNVAAVNEFVKKTQSEVLDECWEIVESAYGGDRDVTGDPLRGEKLMMELGKMFTLRISNMIMLGQLEWWFPRGFTGDFTRDALTGIPIDELVNDCYNSLSYEEALALHKEGRIKLQPMLGLPGYNSYVKDNLIVGLARNPEVDKPEPGTLRRERKDEGGIRYYFEELKAKPEVPEGPSIWEKLFGPSSRPAAEPSAPSREMMEREAR